MSAVDKVLITGVTGFLGAWVADRALAKGYAVVGTCRSPAKADILKKRFEGKPFELAVVKDISADGAFDDVLKAHEFRFVLHTASPFHFEADDPEQLTKPAVQGTLGILNSVHKHAPSVKRICITSSVASIMTSSAKLPRTFTEKDWNEESQRNIEEKGKDASNGDKYLNSKVRAELAAWKFVKDQKPSFDIATICPSLVLGPIIHSVDKEHSLNTSVKQVWDISQGHYKVEDLPKVMSNYVDVRDVAQAHVETLTHKEAGGERFITSAGSLNAQLAIEILNKHANLGLKSGKPGAGEEAQGPNSTMLFDGSKTNKVLGVPYRSLTESVTDLYDSVKARQTAGWKA